MGRCQAKSFGTIGLSVDGQSSDYTVRVGLKVLKRSCAESGSDQTLLSQAEILSMSSQSKDLQPRSWRKADGNWSDARLVCQTWENLAGTRRRESERDGRDERRV